MIILSGTNINKSYGIDVILEDITFTVQENDKIGIVGVNGAGKSTFFKIIAGELEEDSGEIYISKSVRIGYMPQELNLESENNVFDEMLAVFDRLLRLEKEIRSLETRISSLDKHEDSKADEPLLKEYSDLQEKYKENNGFGYRSRIRGVLKGLGFSEDDYCKPVSTLSGGQKTRIALGKLLLQDHDILLLDEPTNSLDIQSVEWLEEYLGSLKCTMLIISHDRYFLDVITNKTFEIENLTLKGYSGNYSEYIAEKQRLREILQKGYEEQQKEISRQEAIIARFRQYNREKSIRQAESREKALERVERVAKPHSLHGNIKLKFEPGIRSGNDVLAVEGLAKSFDQLLFENINFEIKRGERIALLGPNGIGKTTMLKTIAGIIAADAGYVRLGANVIIGYYDQEQENLDINNTVINEIWNEYPGLSQTELRTRLAAFLFPGEDAFKEIGKLSGGEKSRVALLKLILSKSNFLLMDEPTNHLDILSKEVLENALINYSGTVLLVSHDRYFLNKTATGIIELKRNRCIRYNGGYSYYAERKKAQNSCSLSIHAANQESPASAKTDWLKQKEEESKLRRHQKMLEAVEREIEQTEKYLKEIEEALRVPEVFSDHVKCQELHNRQEELEAVLDALYMEWNELSE